MIHLSPVAVGEIQRIQSCNSYQNAPVRLGVSPGGCADYYYTLKLEQPGGAIASEDQVFHCGDIQIVIDSQSLKLVEGLTLDYSEDLMGGGFRFHNPQAVHTCGCGNSFALTPLPPTAQTCPDVP